SETLEGFERSLNDENSRINNLDLNGDNMVDYIRVIDYIDGDAHTIVLQVAVNKRENQDVAVFTVQRYANGQVQVQLTGDEALYGRDYIIEPIFDETNPGQTPNPGYIGNTGRNYGRNVEIVNWPLVRFIFLSSYVPWHSSWYWDYYPSYWHSWQPYYWHYYYGYHYNWYNDYYRNYRRWNYHRYTRWNDFYYSDRRSHSLNVSLRIQSGNYKTTYSHPDQRREGEAMYAKMHPEQNRRSSDNSSGNTVRRSGSQSNQEIKSTGTGNNTTRRSNTAVTNKSVSNPSSGQNAGTTRRSNTTMTNKSVTNQSSGQNAGTARRSNTTVTSKSVSKPSSGQNTGTNRTARKSTTTGVSSSSSRSSRSSKSGTTVNKGGKTKESETTKATRRK
ncbi:MAG: hypothetical protein Q7T72_13835, partial [Bacteroidales bacterium]|nr:hypothetical protein [Bacteroidales bacterium]